MAFKLYSTDDGHVPAWEYHTIASGTKAQVGLGLAMNSNGKLEPSKIPTHICMFSNGGSLLSADTVAPVVAVAPDQIWENSFYSDVSAAPVPGTKVDVADNPLYVDGTKNVNANFEITYVSGRLMSDIVRGRFVK